MKNIITITALLIGIILLGCSASHQFSTTGQKPELTRKSFKTALNALSNNDSILALCHDYTRHSTDINAVRDAQDVWIDLDRKSALTYYEKLYQKNPESAEHTYLYGRLLFNRLKRVEMGRRTIHLDPKWPYGYRLVLYSYYTHLFLGQGDQQTTDSLKATFARDEELFHYFDALNVDRWFNGKMMFHYYLYTGEIHAAEDELDKARDWDWIWVEEAERLLRSRKGGKPD